MPNSAISTTTYVGAIRRRESARPAVRVGRKPLRWAIRTIGPGLNIPINRTNRHASVNSTRACPPPPTPGFFFFFFFFFFCPNFDFMRMLGLGPRLLPSRAHLQALAVSAVASLVTTRSINRPKVGKGLAAPASSTSSCVIGAYDAPAAPFETRAVKARTSMSASRRRWPRGLLIRPPRRHRGKRNILISAGVS